MVHYKYGYQKSEGEVAKARLYNVDASYKDLCAICDNIRGMDSVVALGYLEKVIKKEIPVEYRKWNKKLGHRRELGGKKGRYPVKAAKYVLQVLKNAVANGHNKGLSGMQIVHASANKQAIYPRLQSKGRQMRSDYITSHIEIVLKPVEKEKIKEERKEEIVEKKKESKEEEKKKEKKEEEKVS